MEERVHAQPVEAQPAAPVVAAPLAAPLRAPLGRAAMLRGGGAGLARARLVNGMQARHGNAAVARAILAREETRAEKIAKFNEAKAKGDWGYAAEVLNGFSDDDIQRFLGPLNKQQLRQLDAGAMRQIPGFAGRVHGPIMAKLGKKPGEVFGRLNFLPGAPENGGTPLTAYALPVTFSFAPDGDIVRATEIAYVQTVRLVAHRQPGDRGLGGHEQVAPDRRQVGRRPRRRRRQRLRRLPDRRGAGPAHGAVEP